MDEEERRAVEVRKPEREETGSGNFRTLKSIHSDAKSLYKPPQVLWDDSFIGEAIVEDCHPRNSSFLIGALGGVATGALTGFFSSSRVPLPVRTPIPNRYLPGFQAALRSLIISSSVLWRVAKRGVLGSILFAVLECDFKDLVKRPSEKWKGSIAAGAVSGAVFGLRGGLPGVLIGTTVCSSLPAGWELYMRKEIIRSRIFNP